MSLENFQSEIKGMTKIINTVMFISLISIKINRYLPNKFKIIFWLNKIANSKFITNTNLEFRHRLNRVILRGYFKRQNSKLIQYYHNILHNCYYKGIQQCWANDRNIKWKHTRCQNLVDINKQTRFEHGIGYCPVHEYLQELSYHAYHIFNDFSLDHIPTAIRAEVELNTRIDYQKRFNKVNNYGHDTRLIQLRLLKLR